MKKTLLVVMLLIAIVLVGYTLGDRFAPVVHAQDQCSVPKSYGSLKFATLTYLGFEDASGTIRWVDMDNGCKLKTVIVRQ
jgi:hypothetical protein